MLQHRSPGSYDEQHQAAFLLRGLYATLTVLTGPPSCGDCCDHATPVVSHTEAVHIRDGLHLLPPGAKAQVIARCRAWLLTPTGPATRGAFLAPANDPLAAQREVRWLRQQRCPLLNRDGTCLIQGLEPIECRVHRIPPEDRGPIGQVVDRIMQLVPQRTGFLPAQLMALLRIEDYTDVVTRRIVPDAKTAMSDGRALAAAGRR